MHTRSSGEFFLLGVSHYMSIWATKSVTETNLIDYKKFTTLLLRMFYPNRRIWSKDNEASFFDKLKIGKKKKKKNTGPRGLRTKILGGWEFWEVQRKQEHRFGLKIHPEEESEGSAINISRVTLAICEVFLLLRWKQFKHSSNEIHWDKISHFHILVTESITH